MIQNNKTYMNSVQLSILVSTKYKALTFVYTHSRLPILIKSNKKVKWEIYKPYQTSTSPIPLSTVVSLK